MSDQHDKLQAAATLVRKSVQFAVWAAGEGICPADGEPAEAPDDFVMDYTNATDDADWETLADRLIERIRAAEAKAGEPVAWLLEHPCEGKAVELAKRDSPPLFPADEEAGYTASPLYAAPVDAAALLERITQLEQARDRAHNEAARLRDSGHPDMQKLVEMTAPVRAIHMRPMVGSGNE